MSVTLPVRAEASPALSERILSACFQLLSHVMAAAAQLCGFAQRAASVSNARGLLGAEALAAPELAALRCSELPLSEIAAAERERWARLEVVAEAAVAAPHERPPQLH